MELKKMNVTVSELTEQLLLKEAAALDLTVGEILDRLVLRLSPEDPYDAGLLMTEYVLISAARLSPEQFNQAVEFLCSMLMGAADCPVEQDRLQKLKLAYQSSSGIQ